MPIDEKLLTPKVLANTMPKEVFGEIPVTDSVKVGKVRDVYPISEEELLMVTSDRISAFNVVLNSMIYGKGGNLNAQSEYFFNLTEDIIPNHLKESIHPNAWIVKRAQPVMVEVVLRAYLTGSGWKAYKQAEGPKNGMNFCGVYLRPGYSKNQALDEVVLTPTAKGQAKDFDIPEFKDLDPEEDDPKLTSEIIKKNYQVFGLRKPEDWHTIETTSHFLFGRITKKLYQVKILFVDTKWEFGYDGEDNLMLIDESTTCDSSRFWEKEGYSFNEALGEYNTREESKQFVRDHLESVGFNKWSKTKQAEYRLPEDIVKGTVAIYANLTERITGKQMPITTEPIKESLVKAVTGHLNR